MLRTIAFILAVLAITIPTVAFAAQPVPDDAVVVAGLEKALTAPISWQVLGGALGALALWVVRYWRQIAAIDTRAEYLALLGAVGTPSVAALLSGAPWQVVVVGAVAAFMAFAHLNSGPLAAPSKKPPEGDA